MGWSFENIDWPATEAVGTWAAAIATAAAVYLAATLSQRTARQDALRTRRARYSALGSIYSQAGDLFHSLRDASSEGNHGIRPGPPSLGEFDDLLAVLSGVPLLELGNANSLYDLFKVKRALNGARDRLREYNTPDWMDEHVEMWCSIWMTEAQTAASAATEAARRGVWPHRNRAKEWVFPKEDEKVTGRW